MLGEYWMLEFFLLYMRDFGIPVIVIVWGLIFIFGEGDFIAVKSQYFDTELVDRETGERYDVAFDSKNLKKFYVRETFYYRG